MLYKWLKNNRIHKNILFIFVPIFYTKKKLTIKNVKNYYWCFVFYKKKKSKLFRKNCVLVLYNFSVVLNKFFLKISRTVRHFLFKSNYQITLPVKIELNEFFGHVILPKLLITDFKIFNFFKNLQNLNLWFNQGIYILGYPQLNSI